MVNEPIRNCTGCEYLVNQDGLRGTCIYSLYPLIRTIEDITLSCFYELPIRAPAQHETRKRDPEEK